jgi:hypothetical protein
MNSEYTPLEGDDPAFIALIAQSCVERERRQLTSSGWDRRPYLVGH